MAFPQLSYACPIPIPVSCPECPASPLGADELVFASGYNEWGQLGVGDTEDRLVPTLVRGELEGRKVLQVAAGGNHTVCVTEDGAVFAF